MANCVQKSDHGEVDWFGAAIGLATHGVLQKSDWRGGSLSKIVPDIVPLVIYAVGYFLLVGGIGPPIGCKKLR